MGAAAIDSIMHSTHRHRSCVKKLPKNRLTGCEGENSLPLNIFTAQRSGKSDDYETQRPGSQSTHSRPRIRKPASACLNTHERSTPVAEEAILDALSVFFGRLTIPKSIRMSVELRVSLPLNAGGLMPDRQIGRNQSAARGIQVGEKESHLLAGEKQWTDV